MAASAQAPNKRTLQKIRTRRLILQAGRELFARSGFDLPTVEEIAKAAGITRQTFYLHFPGRDALLRKIFDREVRWQMRQYRALSLPATMDIEAVRDWIRSIFENFQTQKHYILIMRRALTIDPSLIVNMYAERRRFILRIGKSIPQFGIIDSKGVIDEVRINDMQMALLELESVSEYSAFGAWDATLPLAIDKLARRFVDYAGEAD